jgi:hypothetical protein
LRQLFQLQHIYSIYIPAKKSHSKGRALLINLESKYIAFRALGMLLIKAWLADNGYCLFKSHDLEQGHA